jgi:hypothetical protein
LRYAENCSAPSRRKSWLFSAGPKSWSRRALIKPTELYEECNICNTAHVQQVQNKPIRNNRNSQISNMPRIWFRTMRLKNPYHWRRRSCECAHNSQTVKLLTHGKIRWGRIIGAETGYATNRRRPRPPHDWRWPNRFPLANCNRLSGSNTAGSDVGCSPCWSRSLPRGLSYPN